MTLLEDFLYRNGQVAQQCKGEEATTSVSTAASSTLVDEHNQDERVQPEQPHVSLKKAEGIAHEDESGVSLRSRITNIIVSIRNISRYSLLAMTHIITLTVLVWFTYTLVVALGAILRFFEQNESISGVLLWGTIVYLIVSEIGLDND